MASDALPTTLPRSILIVDIVGSTRLYEERGDVEARRAVGACLEVMASAVRREKGRVVKSLGDGLLCVFESEARAYAAAESMWNATSGASETGLLVRIGLHTGAVVEEGGDVFGDTVNTAARISDLAKAGEILMSRSFLDALPSVFKSCVRRLPPVAVKGKREPLELYATSIDDGSTNTIAVMIPGPVRRLALEISFHGQSVGLSRKGAELRIGRGAECEVVVESRFASRLHARIQERQGKFVLLDQSANGTTVVPVGQPPITLRREEVLLLGAGRIYVGVDPTHAEADPLEYRTRHTDT